MGEALLVPILEVGAVSAAVGWMAACASYSRMKPDGFGRAAAIWGELTAKASDPLPLRDSIIGAIARSRGYQVVTRDVAPFERMGCKVLNPWH